MTGSELRRIRNSLELSRVAFGRALGYRGENVDRMIRRLAAGERKITEEVAEIARKLWLAPARERTARASRYLGASSEGARPRSPEDGVAPAVVHHDRGLPFGG
jgi:hypothetical protein